MTNTTTDALNTYDGWTDAALALMEGRPNWTAIDANGGFLTIVDGELYFVSAEDDGYVYTDDDLCPADPFGWDGDAWEGMTSEECRAIIEQPKFVTLSYGNEYALDITIRTSIRVKAPSLDAARAMVIAKINGADMNLGAWPDGSPILAEGTVDRDERMSCYEVNGDDAHPDCDA